MTVHHRGWHPKNILLTCQEVQDKLYSLDITLLPVAEHTILVSISDTPLLVCHELT